MHVSQLEGKPRKKNTSWLLLDRMQKKCLPTLKERVKKTGEWRGKKRKQNVYTDQD